MFNYVVVHSIFILRLAWKPLPFWVERVWIPFLGVRSERSGSVLLAQKNSPKITINYLAKGNLSSSKWSLVRITARWDNF